MPRFFLRLALLLLAAQTAHATLAILIPTRDGFVVATDSRVTYMSAHCDGIPKILVPAQPSRTVTVVTGDSIFVQPPGSKALNPCQWLSSAPRLLDIGAVVTGFLKQSAGESDGDLTQISIADLSAACVSATEQFQQSYPAALRTYEGKEIYSVVLATYDPGTTATTLRSFAVRMAARTGSGGTAASPARNPIEATRVTETKVDNSSSRGVWIYGEADWLDRVVYKGPGRRFLDAATLDFLRGGTPVSEVSLEQAAAVAANLIQAAVRAAVDNPPPTGIGGDIRRMAVGSNPIPQPLPSAPQP